MHEHWDDNSFVTLNVDNGYDTNAAGAAVVGASVWWGRNPSAGPYNQRFWVGAPHPFLTRERLRGARHRIIPDRIEAGTFLVAGAITGGDLNVSGCDPRHLTVILQKLEECGVKLTVSSDSVRVMADGPFKAADITTEEYPGFPTDMQAQYMALLTMSNGTASIREPIFQNRFMHVAELALFGAQGERAHLSTTRH